MTLPLYLLVLALKIVIIYAQNAKPNILFLLVDDLGWANVGYHNDNGEVNTPNIDYLVRHGLELNRHYAHYSCAPSRASLQSGRLPVHVHLDDDVMTGSLTAGIPPNMTCIAERLQNEANYYTAFIGKWDAGATTMEQTPYGRGYSTSFGYFTHTNDYWNQFDGQYVDLWEHNQPAFGRNNTGQYEEDMFADIVQERLDDAAKNKDQPFFIFYATHLVHSPLQIPKEHLMQWDNDENNCQYYKYNGHTHHAVYPGFNIYSDNWHCRSIYQSMANYLDVIIGKVINKLKANDQWKDTLIVFASDNGGMERVEETAGNNYPLRGGKLVPLEGGMRVNAFVSGGYLPGNRRGKIENGILHLCDWYSTFCYLAGLDPTDKRAKEAGLPSIDSMNMWPMISGENAISPRTQIFVDNTTLIDGNYKFMRGKVVKFASWGGEFYPNATSDHSMETTRLACTYDTAGCLFDIINDPTEHINLADSNKQKAEEMNNKLQELREDYYSNNETGIAYCPQSIGGSCQAWAAEHIYGGYWGPSYYVRDSKLMLNHHQKDLRTIPTTIDGNDAEIQVKQYLTHWPLFDIIVRTLEVTEMGASEPIITVTINSENEAFINDIKKSDKMNRKVVMNYMIELLCDFNIKSAGLLDREILPNGINMSYTQAYSGIGYSWYNKWGFIMSDTEKSEILKDDVHNEFQGKTMKILNLEDEYNEAFPNDLYNVKWNDQTIGDFMMNLAHHSVKNDNLIKYYQWFEDQLRSRDPYKGIFHRIFEASNNENALYRNPMNCPSEKKRSGHYFDYLYSWTQHIYKTFIERISWSHLLI